MIKKVKNIVFVGLLSCFAAEGMERTTSGMFHHNDREFVGMGAETPASMDCPPIPESPPSVSELGLFLKYHPLDIQTDKAYFALENSDGVAQIDQEGSGNIRYLGASTAQSYYAYGVLNIDQEGTDIIGTTYNWKVTTVSTSLVLGNGDFGLVLHFTILNESCPIVLGSMEELIVEALDNKFFPPQFLYQLPLEHLFCMRFGALGTRRAIPVEPFRGLSLHAIENMTVTERATLKDYLLRNSDQ